MSAPHRDREPSELPTELERRVLSILDGESLQWRARIGELLHEHPARRDAVVGFLAAVPELRELASELAATLESRCADDDEVPYRIGPYRICQRIGSGGMGAVYLAEKNGAWRQRVALKVIKPDRAAPEYRRRFEAERQVLALMNHPAIARILDGGTTPQGQPYFVMEYVDGAPITNFCDDNRVPLRERLELFVQLCQGVQHAHQKGVIHRDLKPGNVLVTVIDNKRQVKIIDFGIAKTLSEPPGRDTPMTALGDVMGTPEYMSPEQASGDLLEVDAATDVYALGVILFELLVGVRPYERADLIAGSVEQGYDLGQISRVLRESEPPRPSSRLHAETIARLRGAHRRALLRELRSDLDWIALRAIAADRTRRYQSPSELAADIERYLRGDVVSPSPPSTWLHVRKFARRHRGWTAAAITGVSCLAAGLAVALVFWFEARTLRGSLLTQEQLRARHRAALAEADRTRGEAQRLIVAAGSAQLEAQRLSADAQQRLDDALEREAAAARADASREVLEQQLVELEREQERLDRARTEAEARVVAMVEARARAVEEVAVQRQLLAAQQEELESLRNASTAQWRGGWLDRRVAELVAQVEGTAGCVDEAACRALAEAHRQGRWLTETVDGEFAVLGGEDPGRAAALAALAQTLDASAARLRTASRLLEVDAAVRAGDAAWIEAAHAGSPGEGRPASVAGAPAAVPFGLVPLGRHPVTGLAEFWHVGSGARPRRSGGGEGRWLIRAETGMVLVLLPGGTFTLGAERAPGWAGGNAPDPQAGPEEGPMHRTRGLDPFFVAAHELTRGQWGRLREGLGLGPALGSAAGFQAGDGDQLPVTGLELELVTQTLAAWGLGLPYEAQWEYACRGREHRRAPYSFGDGTPGEFAWFGTTSLQAVGQLGPNDHGLFDIHGNAAEWCADEWESYRLGYVEPGTGRRVLPHGGRGGWVVRGGSALQPLERLRSAARAAQAPDRPRPDLGFRAVAALRRGGA